MIEYLLKVSFVIGLAFVFYKAVLQQESFFSTNRLYLVGCIVLAFALPFVPMPRLVSHQGYLAELLQTESATEIISSTTAPTVSEPAPEADTKASQQSPVVPQSQPEAALETPAVVQPPREVVAETTQHSWLFWLGMLYLFGIAIFSLSLLFQVGSIFYKILTSPDKYEDEGCVIVSTAQKQAPCSFFKYIFIHPDDYDYDTYTQIIAHEKIHARQGHSLDLLMAELGVIILWFNPFIWLFRKEIEKNIEYQTDAILLGEEQVSKRQYQLNLLQIAAPHKPLSVTTNYNQSLLKQRIVMMNAKRSTAHAYWKYSFLAPLFFGAMLLLNEPATSQNNPAPELALLANRTSDQQDQDTQDQDTKDKKTEDKKNKDKTDKAARKADKATEKATKDLPKKQAVPVPAPTAGPDPQSIGPAAQAVGKEKPGKNRNRSMNINGRADMSSGYWYSHQEEGQYCLDLKGSRNASNWNISRCFDKGQFQKKGNEQFVMTKETGSLQLTGPLDAEVGQGKYTFTEDAGFKKYLASNNITSDDQNFQFHLFLNDVDKKYVDYLKKQYNDVDGQRLLEFAIHGITMQEHQNYMALFQKYSNKKPSMREVIEAKIHGIDQAYVQQMQNMGYKDLTLKKMMEAKIHGVNAAYVDGLRQAGFTDLSIDKVIAAKIHGMNPASIKEMQSLGYGNLPLDKMMEARIHGVNAAYIKGLQAAGLKDLTLDQVIEAKIHGLNGESIKEIRALGYKDLDFRDLVTAKIHGVDAAYVADLKKAGFQNLSMDKTVEAKIHGINSDFINKARKNGYNLNSIDKYIALKIHGMAIESLKEKE